jgi:hypothetical protein
MNEPSTPTYPTPGDWITPREAAAIIGVTGDHARYLARAGEQAGQFS